jgi:hypothetical protein
MVSSLVKEVLEIIVFIIMPLIPDGLIGLSRSP